MINLYNTVQIFQDSLFAFITAVEITDPMAANETRVINNVFRYAEVKDRGDRSCQQRSQ
jgi:hypothetical protein